MLYLILLGLTILAYAFMRSHGGEGLNIKAKLAPADTKEGKRDRVIAWGIFSLMVAAVVFIVTQQEANHVLAVLIPLFAGGSVFLIANARRK